MGPKMVVRLVVVVAMALGMVACGDDDVGLGDLGDAGGADDDSGELDAGTDAGGGAGGASGNAEAILTVDGEVYRWTADQATLCLIDDIYPADAEFRAAPQGEEGDWVQFLDRGDGGVNFSAVLGGEEYSGTGSGEADEIRSDGFTYTGTMNRDGQNLDVELEVTC
ncbi:MAG TPA: hypothetical protein VK866_13450 [Acidimicrobiales bacterium]|nr:hypothetical protein [Acidimicrobiales bacterium]